MLTLITLLVLAGILLLCARYLCKKDFEGMAGLAFVLSFLLFLSLIIACCSLINKQAEFANIKEQCLNAQSIAQTYDNVDKDRIEALDVMQLVYKTNNIISKHKVYSKSPWTNLWYSREIGELPKIELKTVHDE